MLLTLGAYALARALSFALSRELRWSIMALAFLLAATIVLPSLGIGSVAISFAFKDILQNLFCGILNLLRQPFRIGDEIAVDRFEGKWRTSKRARPSSGQ